MKTSVKKNYAYQMIYEILILFLPFITSPYIARIIGAEGVGIFAYSYSIASYFVLFSMLGIQNYGNRVIAKVRDNKDKLNVTFSSLFCVHAFFSFIAFVNYLGYAIIHRQHIYNVIQIMYVASAIFDISWFYFGIERFKLTVFISSVVKIINVILVFTLIRSANDLWKYCAIMSGSMLISQIALWLPLKRYVSFKKVSIKLIFSHVKPLFVLFVPAIAISLYKYMDKIMIGALNGNEQLGYYENAEKVINIIMTIITSFGTVMLPKMSNLIASGDKQVFQKYISISIQFVMFQAFALAFGLAAVGDIFAPVFWGKGFDVSGKIIRALSITIPFVSFANVIRTQYLIPNEKDRQYLISVIMGAVVNLNINWLLIPTMGAGGAAVGTIIAEITVCLIQAFCVRHSLPVGFYAKQSLPYLIIGCLMFICVYPVGVYMGKHVITLLSQIFLGAIIYGGSAIIYWIITRNIMFISAIGSIRNKLNNFHRWGN